MVQFKSWFTHILDKADDALDNIKTSFQKQLNLLGPLEIVVYHSFINDKILKISGRVLENKSIKEAESDDSAWENFVASYKRMNSDEVRNAKLAITFQEKEYQAVSDKEGYFHFEIPVNANLALPNENPFEVHVQLLDAPVPHEKNVVGKGKVFRPSSNAQIAVVSDIDDTILETVATDFWAMTKNTFFSNVRTRLTFEGVSEFYHALQKGKNRDAYQPIFYVSSSPWNLFDMLDDFLEIQKIPEGVLFLRDYGVDEDKLGTGTHGDHKYLAIKNLLDFYPQLSFVLIGDSGQHDMEIYRQVAQDFPTRIAAIYIRDVKSEKREDWEKDQMAKAAAAKVPMLLSENTSDFVKDAVEKGFVK